MPIKNLILACGGVFVVLVLSEILWRSKVIKGEIGRKFVHMLVGCYVASWPWLLSRNWISIVAAAFLGVLFLSHRYKIFKAITDVKRRTYGDYLFAVGVLTSSLFLTEKYQFLVAMLIIALSDGFAALIGKKFGKKNEFRVYGQTKSMAGSAAFFVVTMVLFMILGRVFGVSNAETQGLAIPLAILSSLVLTTIEAVGIYGLDNILLPVAAGVLFRIYLG